MEHLAGGGRSLRGRRQGTLRRAFLVAAALLPAPVLAQPFLPDDKPHQHEGLYVRVSAGAGYLNASAKDAANRSGLGPAFTFATGYSVRRNLLVFFEGAVAGAIEPSEDTTSVVATFGGGLAWYFMPANIYLSGTIGANAFSIRTDAGQDWTQWGPGASVMVGKEWWVASELGIGVAGRIAVASMADQGGSPRWTTTAVGISLSATFN